MKKIISLLLSIVLVLTLASCGESKYEPQESTVEEATVALTLSIDGKTYEVKYELYRALFLNFKSKVDGGDESVWTSDKKDEYIAKLDALVYDRLCDIYSAFALCDKAGIDLYNAEMTKQIRAKCDSSVDEYISNVKATKPEKASYEGYLEYLKENNLNYSVQELLFRYEIAIDKLDEHYIGVISSDDINSSTVSTGSLKYTEEDIRNYYFSSSCVRVLRMYIKEKEHYSPLEHIESIREKLIAASEKSDSEVSNVIIQHSLIPITEAENGYVMGKYNLDRAYYEPLIEASFATGEGEVSEVITVTDEKGDTCYYVVYGIAKSEEHFEDFYSSIVSVYLNDCVGKLLNDTEAELLESVKKTDFLKNKDITTIKMD